MSTTPAAPPPYDVQPRAHPSTCPQCGAGLAPDQRYCLNCGRRLTEPRVDYRRALGLQPQPAPSSSPTSGGRDSRNALIVLAGLATIVLAVGVGIVIGRGNGNTTTASRPTVVTVAGAAAPPAATPSAGSTAAAASGSASGSVAETWPAGSSGWTVELSSLDGATARASDVSAAERSATAKGAAAAGVLNGDKHSGTPTGKYVIYSGKFSSRKQAQAAQKKLVAKFPGALVLHVTAKRSSSSSGSSGATAAAAGSAGAAQASNAHKLSGSQYEKASQKLPSSIGTGNGAPPPKDNKKAGDGTAGSCIGC